MITKLLVQPIVFTTFHKNFRVKRALIKKNHNKKQNTLKEKILKGSLILLNIMLFVRVMEW